MNKGLSSTNTKDSFHGLLCEAATPDEIQGLVQMFAQGAPASAQLTTLGGAAPRSIRVMMPSLRFT